MAKLTYAQVYALARQAGFSAAEAVTATAVAAAESKLETTVVGDQHLADGKWGNSYGLWQVRSLRAETGTGGSRDATRLLDPAFNARAAYQTWKEAKGKWTPWTMFTNREYQEYLPQARGAASMTGVQLPTTAGSKNSGRAGDADGGLLTDLGSAAGGAAADASSSAVAAGMESIWGRVQPFLVTGGVLVLGLGLIGAGVLVTAWPTARTTPTGGT